MNNDPDLVHLAAPGASVPAAVSEDAPRPVDGDAIDAARYRYIRDHEWSAEVGFWFLDSGLGPGNLDEAVDHALGLLMIDEPETT